MKARIGRHHAGPARGRTASRAAAGCAGATVSVPSPLSAQGLFQQAGDGPASLLFDLRMLGGGALTVALVLLVLMLSLMLLRGRQRLAGERANAAGLRARLDRMEALLDAPGQICIVWSGEDASLYGRLADTPGVPPRLADLLDWQRWLEPHEAATLTDQIRALREQGTRFRMDAASSRGAPLSIEGRSAGTLAVVTIRLRDGAAALASAHAVAPEPPLAAAMHSLLTYLPMPAWIRNRDGRLQWVNRAYATAAGAAGPDQALAEGSELFDSRLRTALNAALKAGGGSWSGELTAEGADRAYELAAIRFDAGSAGLARDITERRREQQLAGQRLEAQERTLDQVNTAIAIFGQDRRLLFFNEAYVTLWQLDPDWLAQRPSDGQVLDALRDAGRLPEQADYRSWKKKMLAEYSQQERKRLWHLPSERTLQVVAEPHTGGGATFFYDDVTEKLKLESERNAIDKERRLTLENLNEGVAMFSADGVLRLYNPAFARMWKLNVGELKKEPRIDQVVAWARLVMDRPDLWARMQAAVTAMGEDRAWDTIRFERPDGSVIDSAIVPLPGGGTLVTFIDITDSARAERALRERAEALEAADRVKNAFIHHVSYVLRAPLTTIIGYADLLARDSSGPRTDKQREFTEHLLTSSHSLLAIINDILDLATIDAGVMELEFAPVDTGAVMHAAATGVQDRVREAGITLDIADPGEIGTFIADDKRLKQVLFNLLTNAVSHSPPRGRVSLRAERDGDEFRFTVEDQGQGIAPELQETIFKPFESHSAGAGHRGAGLGLSIVRALVGLHGGDVRLRSTPGKGTAVTCVFPAGPRKSATAPRRSLPPRESGDTAGTESGGI